MKNQIIILLMTFYSCLNLYSQDKEIIESENFYYRAFKTYLDSLERYFEPIKDLDINWFNLKVKKNNAITYFLKDSFNKYKVEIYEPDSLVNLLTEDSLKTLTLTEIQPININNNKLTINFIHLIIKLKENSLFEEINSGCTLDYKFNCDSNRFELNEFQFWKPYNE